MRITLIGAGGVASSLGPALQSAGHSVLQVWSRTEASARALAVCVGAEAVWADMSSLRADTDLVIVAVKDAVLADIVAAVRPHVSAPIVHTAGSMDGSLADGVLYPMQTFSVGRRVDFSTVHCFVEGREPALEQTLLSLCASITSRANVHRLDTAGRRRLHLAAVFACNFANHCQTLASQILGIDGLPYSILLPLVDETMSKLRVMPPSTAQTGPAVRHDNNVMTMQKALISELQSNNKALINSIYTMMSESIYKTSADNDKL